MCKIIWRYIFENQAEGGGVTESFSFPVSTKSIRGGCFCARNKVFYHSEIKISTFFFLIGKYFSELIDVGEIGKNLIFIGKFSKHCSTITTDELYLSPQTDKYLTLYRTYRNSAAPSIRYLYLLECIYYRWW